MVGELYGYDETEFHVGQNVEWNEYGQELHGRFTAIYKKTGEILNIKKIPVYGCSADVQESKTGQVKSLHFTEIWGI